MSYRVGIDCCFCGAALEIDEASKTTQCGHCGSTMRIARNGLLKYHLRDSLQKREVKFHIERHLKKELRPLASSWGEIRRVFLPFWRVTGTVFSIKEKNIVQNPCETADPELVHIQKEGPAVDVKIIPKDITFCGNDDYTWGLHSLGVRSQVLKLIPVDSDSFGQDAVMSLTLTQTDAEKRFRDSARSYATIGLAERSACSVTSLGLDTSLVYFPLWIADFASAEGRMRAEFDPVAERVVSVGPRKQELPKCRNADISDGAISATPHRCPNCGCDLPPNEKSYTFYCKNCDRLLVERGGDYAILPLAIPEGAEGSDRLFPMWVFDVSSSPAISEQLRSLGYVSNRFFVPAFDISNPYRMIRLISFYNNMHGYFSFAKRQQGEYHFAEVVMSARRAQELILPLAHCASALRGQWKGREIEISNGPELQPELIWLPFNVRDYFWCDQLTGATIEKAAVRQ